MNIWPQVSLNHELDLVFGLGFGEGIGAWLKRLLRIKIKSTSSRFDSMNYAKKDNVPRMICSNGKDPVDNKLNP